mgnify:CR=1 FL=1
MNSYRNKLELITSNGFPATDHVLDNNEKELI